MRAAAHCLPPFFNPWEATTHDERLACRATTRSSCCLLQPGDARLIERQPAESLPDGRTARRWLLRPGDGTRVVLTDLGARLVALEVPDRSGRMADVTLGLDRLKDYVGDPAYLGAVIGRVANRIAGARFTLDGREYRLAANNGPNCLHGGLFGFDQHVWHGEEIATPEGAGVRFTHISSAGDEGFPGELRVAVTYVWTCDHRLILDYQAACDAPTPLNLSHHAYWNLAGAGAPGVLDQCLQIAAAHYLPVDENMIPYGESASVAETPFDFRKPKPIGRDIDHRIRQLARGSGYDHCYVLDGEGLREVAVLRDPASGRRMRVATDRPGLQLYSGNHLGIAGTGKSGASYPPRSAVALEAQAFPDSINQPAFPPAILRPGARFSSRTVYAFDTGG